MLQAHSECVFSVSSMDEAGFVPCRACDAGGICGSVSAARLSHQRQRGAHCPGCSKILVLLQPVRSSNLYNGQRAESSDLLNAAGTGKNAVDVRGICCFREHGGHDLHFRSTCATVLVWVRSWQSCAIQPTEALSLLHELPAERVLCAEAVLSADCVLQRKRGGRLELEEVERLAGECCVLCAVNPPCCVSG